MARALEWAGIDFFQNQIYTEKQTKEAVYLANNFLYPQEGKIEAEDIEQYMNGEANGGESEAWLLHRMSRRLIPSFPFSNTRRALQEGSSIPASRYMLAPRSSQHFEALLLLQAELTKGGLLVNCDALCRDPWADTALCAYWADLRLRAFSELLGGATELQITATERDLPLQKELRSLGYFCWDWDKNTGEMLFGRILQLRDRKVVLSSRKSPPKGSSGKF